MYPLGVLPARRVQRTNHGAEVLQFHLLAKPDPPHRHAVAASGLGGFKGEDLWRRTVWKRDSPWFVLPFTHLLFPRPPDWRGGEGRGDARRMPLTRKHRNKLLSGRARFPPHLPLRLLLWIRALSAFLARFRSRARREAERSDQQGRHSASSGHPGRCVRPFSFFPLPRSFWRAKPKLQPAQLRFRGGVAQRGPFQLLLDGGKGLSCLVPSLIESALFAHEQCALSGGAAK